MPHQHAPPLGVVSEDGEATAAHRARHQRSAALAAALDAPFAAALAAAAVSSSSTSSLAVLPLVLRLSVLSGRPAAASPGSRRCYAVKPRAAEDGGSVGRGVERGERPLYALRCEWAR